MPEETATAMAHEAADVVSVGMTPMGREHALRESEIEELLSDRLVDGCVLMDKSCPACVTPLLKHIDEQDNVEPIDDASLIKNEKSRDGTTKSNQSLTPIDGVPFCVSCQAHVVTTSDEVEKVEEQKQSLKDMVLTALALDDEPLFVCNNPSQQALLKEMDEDQGYEAIKPEQWREDPSVKSRLSQNSSRKSKKSTQSSTFSQKNRRKGLAFEFGGVGEVEVIRAKSTKSRKTERSMKVDITVSQQSSIKEEEVVVEEKREDENATPDEPAIGDKPEDEKDIPITLGLVDKTPESGKISSRESSIAEIDVKKEDCSVDAEELTADFLTLVESEDELLSYEEKKSIAAKALGVKMMQGYSLLEKQCPHCCMPLTEFKGTIDCVVCPALKKKSDKVKHQRDKNERERVRVLLETQLLQQRQLSHAKKNRLYEKTRHLNEVSAHLDQKTAPPTTVADNDKSLNKVDTCQTGMSTNVEPSILNKTKTAEEASIEEDSKPLAKDAPDSSKDESEAQEQKDTEKLPESSSTMSVEAESSHIPRSSSSLPEKGVEEDEAETGVAKATASVQSNPEQQPKQEKVPFWKRGPFKRSKDRGRPVRPVMGIVKITPQPNAQMTRSSSTSPIPPSQERAVSVRSDKPQPSENVVENENQSASSGKSLDGPIQAQSASHRNKADSDGSKRSQQSRAGYDADANQQSNKEAKKSANELENDKEPGVEVEVHDESHDDSSKVSSLHSDSTISTKSRTFRKQKAIPSGKDLDIEVQSIAEEKEAMTEESPERPQQGTAASVRSKDSKTTSQSRKSKVTQTPETDECEPQATNTSLVTRTGQTEETNEVKESQSTQSRRSETDSMRSRTSSPKEIQAASTADHGVTEKPNDGECHEYEKSSTVSLLPETTLLAGNSSKVNANDEDFSTKSNKSSQSEKGASSITSTADKPIQSVASHQSENEVVMSTISNRSHTSVKSHLSSAEVSNSVKSHGASQEVLQDDSSYARLQNQNIVRVLSEEGDTTCVETVLSEGDGLGNQSRSEKPDIADLSMEEDPAEAVIPNGSVGSAAKSEQSSTSKRLDPEDQSTTVDAKSGSVEMPTTPSRDEQSLKAELVEEGSVVSRNSVLVESSSVKSEKFETASEKSRRNHWELLRTESRAFLARRCLVGWKLLPETCEGKECGGVQLVARKNKKECVICGGTGTGFDGVYALLIPDTIEESAVIDLSNSSEHKEEAPCVDAENNCVESPNTQEESAKNIEDLTPDAKEEVGGTFGLEDISIAKSAIPPMSPTMMSLRSNDMSVHTGVSIAQLHRDFESKRSAVSQEIGVKISQGWTLLNLTCPRCVMPLMLDEEGRNEMCLLCGVVGTTNVGGYSVATAATDATSAKSKDTTVGIPTDDEESVRSRSQSPSLVVEENRTFDDKSTISFGSDIRDRIARSSTNMRHQPPRGDPPAVQSHTLRRGQLEAEDSRVLPHSPPIFDLTSIAEEDDNMKAHGPSSCATKDDDAQKVDALTDDNPILIVVEDGSDESTGSEQHNFKQSAEVSANEKEITDESSELFAVAVPKDFDITNSQTVTEILRAAKSSDTISSGLEIDSRPTGSPGLESAAYRLPSPGMTEASLPKMSPTSQWSSYPSMSPLSQRSYTPTSNQRSSRAASHVSYTSSQQTQPWGNTTTVKQYSHFPTNRKEPMRPESLSRQSSFGSVASSRRRVTPETPSRRPRAPRYPEQYAGRGSPPGHHSGVDRDSPSDSPIVQTTTTTSTGASPKKQFMRVPRNSEESVVSSSSSASSSVLLRVAVDKPKGSFSTSGSVSPDFLVCGGPLPSGSLEDIMDAASTLSGNARSVTSEAIDQLLARIEDTQVELVEAEKEEDGIHKQQRLKELLARLSSAAAAIQELDTASRYQT